MRQILFVGIFVLGVFALNAQTKIYCLVGDTVSMNVVDYRGTLQWQSSMDSLSWTDISGATAASLEYLPSYGNQWVRTQISETNCPLFFTLPTFINAQDTSQADYDNTIVVMDTVLVELLPDSAAQASGVYSYLTENGDPGIMAGDIIVGTTGQGYLQFVEYAITNNTSVVLYTSQATLDDLFDDASFSFDLVNDSLDERSSGLNFEFEPTTLAQNGPLTLTLESGSIGMTGDWHGDIEYSLLNGLDYFYYGTENGLLDVNFNLNLNASQEIGLFEGSTHFASFERNYLVLASGLPVIVTLEADLTANYSVELSAGLDYQFNYSGYLALNTGITYSNGEWSSNFDLDPSHNLSMPSPTAQVQASFNFSVVPKLRMRIYSVVVTYINPSAHLDVIGSLASTGIDWDLTAESYAGIEMGLSLELLGANLPIYESVTGESPHVEVYKTPYSIGVLSGNNQIGSPGELLPEPIKFRVEDQWGFPQQNVFVYLEIESGNGTLSGDTLVTDENGECEVLWTLDSENTTLHEFTASSFDGSSEYLYSSPVVVSATAFICGSSFIDSRDGQSYSTVSIGDQCWFAENLRYSGNIPEVFDQVAWDWNSPSTEPAWCYYDNDSTYDAVYGKLYNWFMVNSDSLCPSGWHVPSLSDWEELNQFLGGDGVAGGKLKSTTGWLTPNTGATNESGFTALPGGSRCGGPNGFAWGGVMGYWWSTTLSSDYGVRGRLLAFDDDSTYLFDSYFRCGNSVRCIKD